MFQFSGFTSIWLCIHHTVLEYCSSGFPHSEIHESMDICSSSWLIAACHVLLRLLMPRHSSYALISLTSSQVSLLVTLILKRSLVLLEFLINYMSKSCKVLDTNVSFNTFLLPFFYLKKPLLFLLTSSLYSVFKHRFKHSWCLKSKQCEKAFRWIFWFNRPIGTLETSLSLQSRTPTFTFVNLMTLCNYSLWLFRFSLERRWSSRTFRYGYLVTTSP